MLQGMRLQFILSSGTHYDVVLYTIVSYHKISIQNLLGPGYQLVHKMRQHWPNLSLNFFFPGVSLIVYPFLDRVLEDA